MIAAATVHPLLLASAAVLAAFLLARRRRLGKAILAAGAVVVAVLVLIGAGVVPLPDFEELLLDAGRALGTWTYLVVGVLAFLETGAFIGLIAPGETTVLVGGVVAGQGEISIVVLIGIVWFCAVAGDVTSYFLGRRLGRAWLVRHGPRVKITEDRLMEVERYFDRHGGPTILIGRFIGLVRAIAPFVAGASRMPLARFLPYDVLGAGLWSALFCLLGYFFWRSLDRVASYAGTGAFILGSIAAAVVGAVFVRRLVRDPAYRARVKRWLARESDRPGLRPLARIASRLWYRAGRPLVLRIAPPARFVYQRLTPGELGLELTTLLALAAAGTFAFFFLGELVSAEGSVPALDNASRDMLDAVDMPALRDAARIVSDLGSLGVAAAAVALTCVWAAVRRRAWDVAALAAGLLLTWAGVRLAHDEWTGADADYPTEEAAYAVALLACAVVLVRGGSGVAARFAAVTVAAGAVAAVGLARLYLDAGSLSDVLGGIALGAAAFAACGVLALVVAFVRNNGGAR